MGQRDEQEQLAETLRANYRNVVVQVKAHDDEKTIVLRAHDKVRVVDQGEDGWRLVRDGQRIIIPKVLKGFDLEFSSAVEEQREDDET
jgi:hypothetical protein